MSSARRLIAAVALGFPSAALLLRAAAPLGWLTPAATPTQSLVRSASQPRGPIAGVPAWPRQGAPRVSLRHVEGTNGTQELHLDVNTIIVTGAQNQHVDFDGMPRALNAGTHSRFITQRQAKTDATAAFGKLVAAVVKCFGSVAGIDMNKFKHVWTAAHGLDKLDPADMVWEIVKVVNPGAKGLGAIYITLKTCGTIIKITTAVTPAGAGAMGTAYVVSAIADQLVKDC